MVAKDAPFLRVVRDDDPVNRPLASYLRPFMRDFWHLARLIAEGYPVGKGVVLDPRDLERSDELRQVCRDESLEIILDPLSVELATPGGFARAGVAGLPWAAEEHHQPHNFTPEEQRRVSDILAATAVEGGVTAVLAPTHYLESLPGPWLDKDVELTETLRKTLTAAGADGIAIYYPLVVRLQTIRQKAARDHLLARLRDLVSSGGVDAVWLRIPAFGTAASGPVNLRRYIELARAAHELGVPIVAERTGTVGVALLAMGAVGGIEQGVTFGEGCDIRPLLRPREGQRPFLPPPRVYFPEIGAFLPREQARNFLTNRSVRHWFACQRGCCKRGADDMLADPRRHFIVSRTDEVSELSKVPPALRADHYLETWLRPASDRATRAARVDGRLLAYRERLDRWRTTLGEIRERDRARETSTSAVPTGARVRRLGA